MKYVQYQIDHQTKIAREVVVDMKNLSALVDNFKNLESTQIAKDSDPIIVCVNN